MEYKIIQSSIKEEFDTICNQLSKEGWEPAFAPSIFDKSSSINYFQQWKKKIYYCSNH